MKINEILAEGLWDTLRQIGAGTKGLAQTKSLAGARAATQQEIGAQQSQELVRKAVNSWNIYRGKTGQTNIIPWAKEYFDNPDIAIQPNDINNSADVEKFITAMVQDYARRESNDTEPLAQPATPKQTKQSPKASPTSGATVPAMNVQGFTVVNREPIVVRYQKKDYALNNQGEWQMMTPRGTKAPLIKDTNPTLEKLLDKAAGL